MKLLVSAFIAATMLLSHVKAQEVDSATLESIRAYTAQREKELVLIHNEKLRLETEVEAKLKQLNDANWNLVQEVALVLTSGLATTLVTRGYYKLSAVGVSAWTATVTIPQLINIGVKVGKASGIRKAFNRLRADLAAERARFESELNFIREMNARLGLQVEPVPEGPNPYPELPSPGPVEGH